MDPTTTHALRNALTALNTAPRYHVPALDRDSYQIASELEHELQRPIHALERWKAAETECDCNVAGRMRVIAFFIGRGEYTIAAAEMRELADFLDNAPSTTNAVVS